MRLRKQLLLAVVVLALSAPAFVLVSWWVSPLQTESTIEWIAPWVERFPKAPYVQNPGTTAITIQYEAHALGEGFVKYGEGNDLDQTAPAHLHEEVPFDGGTGCLYRARLTGLKPGTPYRYRVVHQVAGGAPVTSRLGSFRTWPEKADRVTFAVYGDSRTQPDVHGTLARQMARHHPAFIVHGGDAVTWGSSYGQWEWHFFEPLEPVISHIPLFIARGNHDGLPEDLLRWFDLPGGRVWYSFEYGPVHVTVLDCYELGPEMLAWLEQDLAGAKTPWKLAVYHNPTFNLGDNFSDLCRDTFLPLFVKYGVDVVAAGHAHQYERFRPMRVRPDHAITFITTGGGGAPLDFIVEYPLHARAFSDYHYCIFSAEAEKLEIQVFNARGRRMDDCVITKKGGRLDDALLAGAVPIESAILTQGLIKAGVMVWAMPAEDKTVSVTSRLAFPGLGGRAKVTVRLADSSAADYAMDPRVFDVAPDEPDFIELTVRPLAAAGPQDTSGATHRPALRLELKAQSGDTVEKWQTDNLFEPQSHFRGFLPGHVYTRGYDGNDGNNY